MGIEWNNKNPEKVRAAGRRYYWRNQEECQARSRRYRATRLNYQYHSAWYSAKQAGVKITRERLNTLDLSGLCEICGERPAEKFKKQRKFMYLCLDHNHKTKEYRGLLCRHCNVGLGMFYENTAALRRAAAYLEAHS